MRSIKLALALAAFTIVVSIAYVAQQADVAGSNMVSAAQDFVGKLTAEQKKQGVFDFNSDERFNWHFIPLQDTKTRKYTRKGVPIEEMTPEQKKAALALVKA